MLVRVYRNRLYRYLPAWVAIGIVPASLAIQVLQALPGHLIDALTGWT